MEFKQEAKNYLLSQGYTQGATKTTDNNFQKGMVELVINDTTFECRRVVAGNILSRNEFKRADLVLIKKAISKEFSAIFVGKFNRKNDKKTVA